MKLFTYFRSSAAYRVRIVLNYKGIPHGTVPVHLVRDGGQQHSESYREVNPQGFVPALADDGHVFAQSLAIIEYLEETNPDPPLLPPDFAGRAIVRSMALGIACDIHPLNNLRVTNYLRGTGSGRASRRWRSSRAATAMAGITCTAAASRSPISAWFPRCTTRGVTIAM
ncbi:MAG: maleylacetoacetate isomerase [Steroidobacteraceae bacterium]|nr:maleylacetoacetate isomerase [Steroidobacteraceae bacterium]